MSGRIAGRWRPWRWGGCGLLVAVLLVGCKSRTETGYEPRKLGDSLTIQRGYYAAPFTTEARQAAMERLEDAANRRPDVGPAARPY